MVFSGSQTKAPRKEALDCLCTISARPGVKKGGNNKPPRRYLRKTHHAYNALILFTVFDQQPDEVVQIDQGERFSTVSLNNNYRLPACTVCLYTANALFFLHSTEIPSFLRAEGLSTISSPLTPIIWLSMSPSSARSGNASFSLSRTLFCKPRPFDLQLLGGVGIVVFLNEPFYNR